MSLHQVFASSNNERATRQFANCKLYVHLYVQSPRGTWQKDAFSRTLVNTNIKSMYMSVSGVKLWNPFHEIIARCRNIQ